MTDKSSWRLGDDVTGDVLPESVRQALRDVPLAAVRRAFPPRRAFPACDHRDAQLAYRTERGETHYCPDCGRFVAR